MLYDGFCSSPQHSSKSQLADLDASLQHSFAWEGRAQLTAPPRLAPMTRGFITHKHSASACSPPASEPPPPESLPESSPGLCRGAGRRGQAGAPEPQRSPAAPCPTARSQPALRRHREG